MQIAELLKKITNYRSIQNFILLFYKVFNIS